jgi:hypothetical protein
VAQLGKESRTIRLYIELKRESWCFCRVIAEKETLKTRTEEALEMKGKFPCRSNPQVQ